MGRGVREEEERVQRRWRRKTPPSYPFEVLVHDDIIAIV